MNRLKQEDIDKVVGMLPHRLSMSMQKTCGVFVAGGFIRDTVDGVEPRDLDVFTSENSAHIIDDLLGYANSSSETSVSHSMAFSDGFSPVQFVKSFHFDTFFDAIDWFDFTVVQAVVYFENGEWNGRCSDRFYRDINKKRLMYQGSQSAAGSLKRMVKFLTRGYDIDEFELAQLIAAFNRGMDSEYDGVLINGDKLAESLGVPDYKIRVED